MGILTNNIKIAILLAVAGWCTFGIGSIGYALVTIGLSAVTVGSVAGAEPASLLILAPHLAFELLGFAAAVASGAVWVFHVVSEGLRPSARETAAVAMLLLLLGVAVLAVGAGIEATLSRAIAIRLMVA